MTAIKPDMPTSAPGPVVDPLAAILNWAADEIDAQAAAHHIDGGA